MDVKEKKFFTPFCPLVMSQKPDTRDIFSLGKERDEMSVKSSFLCH
jgi:hypothetical protein